MSNVQVGVGLGIDLILKGFDCLLSGAYQTFQTNQTIQTTSNNLQPFKHFQPIQTTSNNFKQL
jgi:hypothetical protein